MTPFNTIGDVSPVVASYHSDWHLVDTLRGGTQSLRLAGKTFLPKEEKETEKNYKVRLNRSTFDNFYAEAIDRAVDKVFARDIVLKNQPVDIVTWWEDVDTQGRDGTQFAKEVFWNAVHHGVTYILTDYPRLPSELQPDNYAQEQELGLRPYWLNIKAPQVLSADSEFIGGRERLASFRYKETVYELQDDGYTLKDVQQVRHYKQRQERDEEGNPTGRVGPVEFEVWRISSKSIGTGWELYDSGTLPVDAIPVVAIYGNRTGFYLGSPVQMPLAELNIQHWRKRSDLDNILHVANVPFLFAKKLRNGPQVNTQTGQKKEEKIEVDIQQAVMTENADADIKWVEHTGTAIKSAMEDLSNLEQRMRDLGSTLFSSGGGFHTSATEKTINAAEANAKLKSLALSLQDGLEYALFFVKQYAGVAPTAEAKVEVNTSFATDYVAQETFASIVSLYKMGLVDRELVISEAKRRNIIALDQEVKLPVNPVIGKGADNEVVPPVTTEDASGNKNIIV